MERNILTSGKTISMASGRAIMGDGTAITDADGIITGDMTDITTGVMFVMTIVGIITGPRFDRISKMFAMPAMKSNKIARKLRGDYQELRKDRAELRRDIRNGASKAEIYRDRQEIRADVKEIRKDRTELRHDQGTLQSARRELSADLRKRYSPHLAA